MNKAPDKKQKIENFDVDGALNADNNIFGLPFTQEESAVVLIPVPWDVTVSSKDGTSCAPESIVEAALQIEIFDKDYVNAWHAGYYMIEPDRNIQKTNKTLRAKAHEYIRAISSHASKNEKVLQETLSEINLGCAQMNTHVHQAATEILNSNKIACIVGGDHSTPLGLLQALSAKYDNFSILQIDAHADLRDTYEGFCFSHASIMFNALKLDSVKTLTQVGIRDYGQSENLFIQNNPERIRTFFDDVLREQLLNNTPWKEISNSIISTLSDNVYISFDIDGLSPDLCPSTGTPVPGGLRFFEAVSLIHGVVNSGKKIIGFDLCETGASKNLWDETVAARILYKLCNATAASNKLF